MSNVHLIARILYSMSFTLYPSLMLCMNAKSKKNICENRYLNCRIRVFTYNTCNKYTKNRKKYMAGIIYKLRGSFY